MNQPSKIILPVTGAEEDYCNITEAGNNEKSPNLINRRELLRRPPPVSDFWRNIEVDDYRQIAEYFANFVPETVQRLIAANPGTPELSMRERDVSVLFIDISGYSSLSEKMSPDALNTLVERYFSTFLDCIYEAGGDTNEIAGDGLMTIFQDASPHQHSASATTTALAILAATEALNKENRNQHLSVHMGLNSGVALVGLTRLRGQYSTRWTFTARGPMTNLAARLADGAKSGQILAGPETVRRLRQRYLFQRLGCERFKNIAEPIHIYRLLCPA